MGKISVTNKAKRDSKVEPTTTGQQTEKGLKKRTEDVETGQNHRYGGQEREIVDVPMRTKRPENGGRTSGTNEVRMGKRGRGSRGEDSEKRPGSEVK